MRCGSKSFLYFIQQRQASNKTVHGKGEFFKESYSYFNFIFLFSVKILDTEVGLVEVKQKLDFASAEYLKEKVLKFINLKDNESIRLIIIDGREINSIDYTVAMVSF